ncbi:uncharacterized protein VTP21DRAFT_7817 [Calcarisporiella thermophila]|uniref:uncharacterized protein n=1 Tax=Calcarisporiella thermophila TaxID=911321 RepID=UPI003742B7BB
MTMSQIPQIPGTDPECNVMDIFRNMLAKQVAELADVTPEKVVECIDFPRQPEHGDLAIAVPRLRLKGNPTQIAKDLVEKFVPNDYITSASCISAFVNFSISKPLLSQLTLSSVIKRGEDFGKNRSGEGKTALVEFSSPNIAKPFHAGHLRGTIIGSFVVNALKANGWKTISMNYLGDWGKQYGLLAVGFERHGSEEALEKDPIHHLYEVYVKINADAEKDPSIHDEARAYFKQMEDGDEKALSLWRKFRDFSIDKYRSTYAALNVCYDVYSGESQVPRETIERALGELEEKGLLKDSDGAKIVELEKYKLSNCVVKKKDGTSLYITRDIGAAIDRYEKFKFDQMFYIVGSPQDLHLKQLFKILELLGYEWASRCTHINFGLITGMSTRKGTVVFLDDILEQTKETMHSVMRRNERKYAQIENPDAVAEQIGVSAVFVQDMSARRIKNYEFDWQRCFSFEGDTGAYLQYAHARMCSIERNAGFPVNFEADYVNLVQEPVAIELVSMLAQYPDLVRSLTKAFEPCNVITYAMKLSHLVSTCLESLWVQGQERPLAEARLLLYYCARLTLGNAMRLVGMRPLERM